MKKGKVVTMRITNGMMINNSLNNINTNKLLLDNLNTQLASQKKIQRPSDDPIVAIRSLRYNSTLTEINQYLKSNIPEARSWMDVTADSLENTVTMLDSVVKYITGGANGTLNTTNRESIISTLQGYRDQMYADANTDCAGRTVFTGYKTDETLTYTSDEPSTQFSITQKFASDDIASVTKVINGVDVSAINDGSDVNLTVKTPTAVSAYRLRLGYDNLEDSVSGPPVTPVTISYTKSDGTPGSFSANVVSQTDSDAYTPTTGVNYIPETGEVYFSAAAYADVVAGSDISITYEKKGFEKGELKPEHFFDCKDLTTNIQYSAKDQSIEYAINFNQELKINTQPDEVYTHDMTRDLDDLVKSVSKVSDIEDKISKLNTLLKNETEGTSDYTNLESLITLTNKELDLAKENMQKAFEANLTTFTDHFDRVGLAKADLGSRMERLTLNETRLSSQKTTVTELRTKNESVVLTDIAVEISAAQDVYDASLSAAAKVVTKSLLDFI